MQKLATILEQRAKVEIAAQMIVPKMVDWAERLNVACHVCGKVHEKTKPKKFCIICFSTTSQNHVIRYRPMSDIGIKREVWHYIDGEKDKPICHTCYTHYQRKRNKQGVYDPTKPMKRRQLSSKGKILTRRAPQNHSYL